MAKDWWNYSWNLAVGCTKVSDECCHCWAEAMAKRLLAMGREEYQEVVGVEGGGKGVEGGGKGVEGGGKGVEGGGWTGRVTLVCDRLGDPLRLRKPRVIAVNLMGDLFHEQVPLDFLTSVFDVMSLARQHVYILLTKRAERMLETINRMEALPDSFPHVWLGTSAGNQAGADERRDSMWALAKMGWNTWVSSEPRVEAIQWDGWEFLKFAATGGESGPRARIMDPAWPRADREWFKARGIPWMFKQWGEWVPLDHLPWVTDETTFRWCPVEIGSGVWMVRVGKALAGHVLDGEEYREMPWTL